MTRFLSRIPFLDYGWRKREKEKEERGVSLGVCMRIAQAKKTIERGVAAS